MKRLLSLAASIVGPLVLVILIWTFQVRAIPIQSPTTWRDDFDDDSGLDTLVDTEVVTATGHLVLARSPVNPDQYVTSGMATSVLINPLVASVPAPIRFDSIVFGGGDFLYLIGLHWVGPAVGQTEFYSYQLSSGELRHIHSFPEGWDYKCGALAIGSDGRTYMSVHVDDHLYVYDPGSDNVNDLGAPIPTSSIRDLAAAPSGLIYGIAGLHLFFHNPTTSSFSDLGVISAEISGRTALAVADNGKVYGGYERSNQGRLFVYNPTNGIIVDKGQILGQVTINTLTAGPDGRIYGGTTSFCGNAGRFFAYDPATDSLTDLAGSYGGVYALLRGQDDRIYGGARRNGWELYLFIYDPEPGTLQEIKPIKSGRGHVSDLAWTPDGRVYGSQVEYRYSLVVYDSANNEFTSWDTVSFSHTAPPGTAIRIDVLDAQDNPLLVGVNNGDSLSVIDPAIHPAIKLCANLSGSGSDTPLIDSWSVRVVVPWTLYDVSGRVIDVNNSPVAGVTLSAGAGHTTVTDENGVYTFNDLPPGTYTLTPSKTGCFFTPSTRTVSVPPDATGQDFEGHCEFDISGRVLDGSYNPFAGVQISAGAGRTTITDANGHYTFTKLLSGTYTLTPSLAGYTFWPATRTVTLPPDATGQNFIILPEPVSITLPLSGTASLPASLIYTDTQGLTTTLDFPAGAVTETTTLILTPTLPQDDTDSTFAQHTFEITVFQDNHTLPWGNTGFAFAGHTFEIVAFRNDHPLPSLTFNKSVTVTIHYSNQDVRVISDTSQLALGWWTGNEWEDAASTCDPSSVYNRDLAKRVLGVPICHLSLFSLLGPTHQIYLPLVLRGH